MNLYKIKRKILFPYRWYMRQKERHLTGVGKDMLELYYYSPAIYGFFKAAIKNPDILYEAPNINSDSIVIDVGGYIGDFSSRVFEKYQPHIYCFEVDAGYVKCIAERFQANPKIHCFDFGLSNKNASLELIQKGMGSTLYADAGEAPGDGNIVRVRDVVEVFNELKLDKIDLLKLNIEGGEYDVLERLIEANRLKDVVCLMVQFHEWLNGAYWRRYRIRKALRKTHRLVWDYPFVWEQWVRR
jgi:FkbM family methyltransferase